jgi:hypothetical protein
MSGRSFRKVRLLPTKRTRRPAGSGVPEISPPPDWQAGVASRSARARGAVARARTESRNRGSIQP